MNRNASEFRQAICDRARAIREARGVTDAPYWPEQGVSGYAVWGLVCQFAAGGYEPGWGYEGSLARQYVEAARELAAEDPEGWEAFVAEFGAGRLQTCRDALVGVG